MQVLQLSSTKLEQWDREGQCVCALTAAIGADEFLPQGVHRLQRANAPREVDFADL